MRGLGVSAGWFLLLAACGHDYFTIAGAVSACSDGSPLVGVRLTVTVDDESVTSFSEPDGSYNIGSASGPLAAGTFLAEKPGYQTVEMMFERAPERPVDFCLEAIDTAE